MTNDYSPTEHGSGPVLDDSGPAWSPLGDAERGWIAALEAHGVDRLTPVQCGELRAVASRARTSADRSRVDALLAQLPTRALDERTEAQREAAEAASRRAVDAGKQRWEENERDRERGLGPLPPPAA